MIRRARRVSIIACACLFLVMTVGGTAFAAGVTRPHLDASDHTKITNGCTNITVHGTNLTPSTNTTTHFAGFFIVQSTDGLATGSLVLPVDARGRAAGTLVVCNITVSPEAIQLVLQNGPNGFYSNDPITIARSGG